jgi:hypothetical protein
MLSCYHDNVIMLSWQTLSCHFIMITLSCYHDNMLSYFFPENFTHPGSVYIEWYTQLVRGFSLFRFHMRPELVLLKNCYSIVITICLVITNGTFNTRRLVIHSWQLREHFSSLQLPSDHYKPLSYDEEFRHWLNTYMLLRSKHSLLYSDNCVRKFLVS